MTFVPHMTRLEQLHQFLQEDPTDPFNLYALAIEYQKTDIPQALKFFDRLLSEHEVYLPTYYSFARLCADTGDTEKAIRLYKAGVEKARTQGEQKTLRELQAALDELIFE